MTLWLESQWVRGPTANLDGGLELQQVWLAHEDFTSSATQLSHFMFCKLHLFAWTCVPARQQAGNDVVESGILLQAS